MTRVRPGELWPDDAGVHINAHGGGVLFHDGVYYWFGEHKTAGEAGNRANVGVGVYTSRDLLHWTNAGVALAVSHDPQSPIARGCILERPKVLYNARTRRFVMWFHLEPAGAGYSGATSGVAVAQRAEGPYTFVRALRPNVGIWPRSVPDELRRPLSADELTTLNAMELGGAPRPYFPRDLVFRRDLAGGQMARDMTLFLDDDGSAYQIYASEDNGTLHISLLADDFLGHAGQYVRILPGRFHEAPAVMKHEGRYWLFSSECTGWSPNMVRLSVADSIWGPWTELTTPCMGPGAQVANGFESQPTFVLPVAGKSGAFIYMADRWRPRDAVDGRYVWLPVAFRHGVPTVRWRDEWSPCEEWHLAEENDADEEDDSRGGGGALSRRARGGERG